MTIIGIDFGTTNSSCAVYKDGKLDMIPDDGNASCLIPSIISFDQNGEVIIGKEVSESLCNRDDLHNVIYDIKRLIARSFNDTELEIDGKRWPFHLIDKDNEPQIYIQFGDEMLLVSPSQAVSYVLKRLKENAEKYLNETVTEVVIGLPVALDQGREIKQRKTMMEAAEIAGLKIVDFITEPNAAAMAYSHYLQSNIKQILVYDFGGGTLDISIIRYDTKENITVLSVSGDPHLGGNDFDARLVSHFMDQYDRENEPRKFPRTEHSVVQRLYRECRRVKEALSTSDREIKLQLSHVNGNKPLINRLTRDIFNKLCVEQIDGTIIWVDHALEKVNMTANDIDQVLLAGGSSRIPRVRKILEDKFGREKVLNSSKFIPEHAIALGAAIRAHDLEKITNTTPVRADLNDANNASAIKEKVEITPNSSETTANQPSTSIQNKKTEPELVLVPGPSKQEQPSKADVIYTTFKNLVVSEKKLIEVIADTVDDMIESD